MTYALNSHILDYAGGDAAIEVDACLSEAKVPGGRPVQTPAKVVLNVGPGGRSGPLPAVSCLMVTSGRFEQAKVAIDCYRSQTWQRRELVIVDQSGDGRLATWVKSLRDSSIRIFSQPRQLEPLGAMRNRCAAIARGHFLCQWDDDDLQHPLRIEMAMAAMAVTRASACMLFREMTWYTASGRVSVGERRPHENTLLAARRVMPTYPSLPAREAAPAVEALLARHSVILIDAPELYVYVAHGNNTWPASHMEGIWKKSTERFEGTEADAMLSRLAHAYPIDAYPTVHEAA